MIALALRRDWYKNSSALTSILFQLIGGIGLFLLGIIMLSDGLKAFAGDALRRALIRFTGTPLKAFGFGALVTVMVQSSSATTITVIGFVSAGLLTFPQAVGVVVGASFGTTGTSWIVSVLGLKISLGFYALPLIGIGAILRLLVKGRWNSIGTAMAGFGLVFVGIETMQIGMKGMSGTFDFAKMPNHGLFAHIVAFVVGLLMTIIMQSSGAAIATTLTALHTGTVNFEQAASLVIGAAIGTTLTGALAAIGGSVPAKRTALAHVLFNSCAGLIALVCLPALLWIIRTVQELLKFDAGAASLAAFHTMFIGLGVVIFLPFVNQFSGWIERLLPDKGPALTRHLDKTLLSVPEVALEATHRVLRETACETFALLRATEETGPIPRDDHRIVQLSISLDETQRFFSKIPSVSADSPLSQLRVAQLHAIDHLVRLQSRLRNPVPASSVTSIAPVIAARDLVKEILQLGEQGLHGQVEGDWVAEVAKKAGALSNLRRTERADLLEQTAEGDWDPAAGLEILDRMRWLDSIGYHTWRICHYLAMEGNKEVDADPGRFDV